MQKVNLREKLGLFDATWSPRVVGALNGQLVKLAKLEGAFVWHAHADEDELFLVLEGSLTMQWREANGDEHSTELQAGEMFIVPRGVEHNPVAGENGASVLLFEPAATKHTGDVVDERTQTELEWI